MILLSLSKKRLKNQSPDTRGAGKCQCQCTVAPAAFWKCVFLGHPVVYTYTFGDGREKCNKSHSSDKWITHDWICLQKTKKSDSWDIKSYSFRLTNILGARFDLIFKMKCFIEFITFGYKSFFMECVVSFEGYHRSPTPLGGVGWGYPVLGTPRHCLREFSAQLVCCCLFFSIPLFYELHLYHSFEKGFVTRI